MTEFFSVHSSIVSIALAALATVIAFSGPTHRKGRPIWALNLRGSLASTSLIASVFYAFYAENLHQDSDRLAAAQRQELLDDLSRARSENAEMSREISDLNQQVNEANRQLEEIQTPLIRLRLSFNNERGHYEITNDGRQAQVFADSVEETIVGLLDFSAACSRVDLPFSVELPTIGWRFGRQSEIIYRFHETHIAGLLNDIEAEIENLLQSRVSEDCYVAMEWQACARVTVKDNLYGIEHSQSIFATHRRSLAIYDHDGLARNCFENASMVPSENSMRLPDVEYGGHENYVASIVRVFSEVAQLPD